MSPDKIYLVGFMASGKSTVARALAKRLGWRAEDIDELIEQRDRRTIPEIFAQAGEPYTFECHGCHLLFMAHDHESVSGPALLSSKTL